MNIIQTDRLTKKYGRAAAVEHLSICVGKGEIYGFLGLNGAGKTTTIRMLLGMIRPTAGAAYLLDKKVDAGGRSLWSNVGYLVEVPYGYPGLTVKENLEIAKRLHHISDAAAVAQVMDTLQLTPYQEMKAKHLSLGNAQRLGLAKALIHSPSILILDEPANGLDPAGIVEIRKLLLDLALNHGVTIVISSHILGEISKLATRIGIIDHGRLVQEVPAEKLEFLLLKRLKVDAPDRMMAKKILTDAGFSVTQAQDEVLEITDKSVVAHPEEIARILTAHGTPPNLLKVEAEDLETYFLRMIGREA